MKILTMLLIAGLLVSACKKEAPLHADITKDGGDTYVPGQVDKWLDTNFLDPYNIEVLYRFDRFQAAIDKELVPIDESRVIPVMETVRDIWIGPYFKVSNKEVLKPLFPKQFMLIGSAEYNTDGSFTLGNADAGRRINLFELNDYQMDNAPEVTRVLHTVHHEFTHILHQNIPVPPDYEQISPQYLGGSWVSFSNTLEDAKNLGFITKYSRMNKDEDFAEVTSTLLVEGQENFDAFANTASETGRANLKKKEQMVVDYFKQSYNMEFRVLQEEVKKAKEEITGVSAPLSSALSDGAYQLIQVNATAAAQPDTFKKVFARTMDSVRNVSAANPLTLLTSFTMEFTNIRTARNFITLKLKCNQGTGTFDFWFDFNVSLNASTGRMTFAFADEQGTAAAYNNANGRFKPGFLPLIDFLQSNRFEVQWMPGSPENGGVKVAGFADADDDATLFFYGTPMNN